jgi:hypothetical protein
MNAQYTNRELDNHFDEIKVTLTRIENQVVKTNGRVGSLENWRWLITGGLTVIVILIVPIILSIINNSFEMRQNNIVEQNAK